MPAYAPELNPAEGIWAYLKIGVLANLAARGLDHLIRVVKTALKSIQYRPEQLRGFLAGGRTRTRCPIAAHPHQFNVGKHDYYTFQIDLSSRDIV